MLQIRAGRGRVAPGEPGGRVAAEPGQTVGRQHPPRRGGRDGRPGRGAVHGRVPEAGGVFRVPGDRRVYAGRVLRQDDAVDELDDDVDRRPIVQPVQGIAEVEVVRNPTEPAKG